MIALQKVLPFRALPPWKSPLPMIGPFLRIPLLQRVLPSRKIRAMFSGAPTPNKPFPTLQFSSLATPTRNQEGLRLPPKSLPKATSKSAPIKQSQKGPVPSSLPIDDFLSTPRALDSVPHVGKKIIVSHVTPTVDPDLEDLCDHDVSDDEKSGRTPAKDASDRSQPPPLRSDTDTRKFQTLPIIPV
ncbi:hypothetical protein GEMRC1_009782 [Eukaryota sp. GEM-RC1]